MTTNEITNLRLRLQDIEDLMINLKCIGQELMTITTQANELTLEDALPKELEEKLKRIKNNSYDLLMELEQ